MARNPTVWVVDDDDDVRDALSRLLDLNGFTVEPCRSGHELLEQLSPDRPGCVVLDVRMPGFNGLAVQREMGRRRLPQPVIFVTGHADVPTTVQAFRADALHLLEKPVTEAQLVSAVREALAEDEENRRGRGEREHARALVETLSPREGQVGALVAEGLTSEQIAERLGLSVRTIDMHRSRLLRRLGARTTAEAVRILQTGGALAER